MSKKRAEWSAEGEQADASAGPARPRRGGLHGPDSGLGDQILGVQFVEPQNKEEEKAEEEGE